MLIALYFFTLIAAIAVCIVAFLLISAGDLTKFKSIHRTKTNHSILPIITRYGDLIATPQDLDFHLTTLKARLKEKYQVLDNIKAKVHNQLEQLQKYDGHKMGCMELQANLVKTEEECKELHGKIDYFRQVQEQILEDLAPLSTYMGDADWMVGTSRVTI